MAHISNNHPPCPKYKQRLLCPWPAIRVLLSLSEWKSQLQDGPCNWQERTFWPEVYKARTEVPGANSSNEYLITNSCTLKGTVVHLRLARGHKSLWFPISSAYTTQRSSNYKSGRLGKEKSQEKIDPT